MFNINPKIAIGAMKLLANGSASADFSTFGLSRHDFEMFMSENAWVAADRPTIERINGVLAGGTMDVIGVPRFPISAEYAAAILAMFVHPTNLQTACNWAAHYPSNIDLADGSQELGQVFATPGQLFALCLMLLEADPAQYRLRFLQRTGLIEDDPKKK